MMDWAPIILTFQLAFVTTIILFVIGVPLAHWLAYSRSKIAPVIEAFVSMPLVLPPTVLGFYLLIAFSPSNWFGQMLDQLFGLKLIFSFQGLVLASVIYSLPFMVQPIRSGFANLPGSLSEASAVLGKSRYITLVKVLVPCIKPSIITGFVLAFAHTIGEFGVVLMIGGNIPGVTRVASVAIYDEVESLNYAAANTYSLFLFIVCFAILFTVYLVNRGNTKINWKL